MCTLPFTNHPECDDGEVRLVRGQQENEGQVEFCRHRRWGLVCRNFWDIKDANVACRQLGYHGNEARYML